MSDGARRNGDAKPAPQSSAVAPVRQESSVATVAPAQAAPVKAAAPKEPAKDVVLIGPPTADGAGVHVIRAREERIETGELRALEEGKPILGEVVTLKPREENPRVCDVTECYAPPAAQAAHGVQLAHKGPAKVASPAYRDGWDEIFGKKPPTPTPPRSLN